METDERRIRLRDERAATAHYRGGIEIRMISTFVFFAVLWVGVIVLGISGVIPLWLGLILNTIFASTFYMPMHEAAHGNIWGNARRGRWVEDLIGMLCAIPLGFSFKAHRPSHMRHHAYTNDPSRDPDFHVAGPMHTILKSWYAQVMLATFLPVFAFVPPARRLIPASTFAAMGGGANDRRTGLIQLRFWILSTAVLVIAFLTGFGWPALLLWYLPSRLQALWLLTVFAWFPHHPSTEVGRYVDTRVAVFPGSGLLIRGHDHHAVHHLFPRVPHYRLRKLWNDIADDMVAKGVRSEGRATGATGPIIW
ncbi:MAG: fatty acid desaturase [Actinomycetes bacterium]